jgi:hypothetical protein
MKGKAKTSRKRTRKLDTSTNGRVLVDPGKRGSIPREKIREAILAVSSKAR